MLDKPCLAPFTSINLDSTGQVVPCCVYKMKGNVDHKVWDNNLNKSVGINIKKKFNSWDKLRKNILKNKYPSNCNICKLRSQSGKTRADDFRKNLEPFIDDEFNNPKILMMDLDLSNKCNLKCLHCSSSNSTAWIKDSKKLFKIDNNKFDKQPIKHRSVNNIKDLYNFPEITKDLKIVEIKGGEPLYQDQRYDILEVLIDHDVSKNITLKYITNMTVKDEKLLKLWCYFKKIKLHVSIEGTDKLYNFIRGDKITNVNMLEKNILWYREKIKKYNKKIYVNWSVTVMACNIFDVENIFNFIKKLNVGYNINGIGSTPTLVVNPDYLDYRVLPRWYIDKARKQMKKSLHKSVINFEKKLTYWKDEERIPKFKLYIEYIENISLIRNINPNTIPFWKELKNEYLAY